MIHEGAPRSWSLAVPGALTGALLVGASVGMIARAWDRQELLLLLLLVAAGVTAAAQQTLP